MAILKTWLFCKEKIFFVWNAQAYCVLSQVDADEAMANAERDLKADAEWKRIQQNTFTRWANEHLKQADKQVSVLKVLFLLQGSIG